MGAATGTGRPLGPLTRTTDRCRRRALGALWSDRFRGWAGPLLVTIIGGLQRFWRLDLPHKLIFDEVYYVKEAASDLRVGHELVVRPVPTGSPDPFTLGQHNVFANTPDFVVHPPVGKWMIAAGEWLFGVDSSWGWRFSAAVVGTVSILMLGRIARRLFGSTLLGATASLLLAVDGLEFVHSRTGLLDIFVMFWALAGFGCLLIDRDRARALLTERLTRPGVGREFGPWLGIRWWRIAGVICLALDTGTKWSGLYFTATFLVMSALWDCATRRSAGIKHWITGAAAIDATQALATTVLLLPTVYLSTWAGWLHSTDAWDRQWATTHPAQPGWAWVPDTLRSLLHYHCEMWNFNVSLTEPHTWQANPWAWLVLGRPTLFLNDQSTDGHAGCHLDSCNQMITDLGNPVIWWGGTLAIGVLVFRWALARDWRAGAVLAGLVGGYLPWFLYQQRTIFEFYAVAFVPWMVLAVTYCLGLVLGPTTASPDRRRAAALAAGGYVLASVLVFWFFYPVLAGRTIPTTDLALRHWLTSWF
jgi:dolichyl-phosphate-mannose-protein mannosyltransferase